MTLKRLNKNILTLLGWSILFVLWEIISFLLNNEILFPSLKNVLLAFFSLLKKTNTYLSIFNTLNTLILSFTISFFIALVLAITVKKFNFLKYFITPYITIIKSIPTIALILIIIIWSNLSNVPFLIGIAISLGVLFDMLSSAISSVDLKLLKMSKVFSVSRYKILKNIYVPSIYYSICHGLHSIISLTFKVIIAGEVLAQLDNKIGGELFNEKNNLNTPYFFAWLLIVLIISFTLDVTIKFITKKMKKIEVGNNEN
ncbi:MAG: ABC transporter permease [Fusobacteriaceae bacterium]